MFPQLLHIFILYYRNSVSVLLINKYELACLVQFFVFGVLTEARVLFIFTLSFCSRPHVHHHPKRNTWISLQFLILQCRLYVFPIYYFYFIRINKRVKRGLQRQPKKELLRKNNLVSFKFRLKIKT